MSGITGVMRAGYSARRAVGETITFRDSALKVPHINRSPSRRDRERFNFEEGTQSIVELPPDLDEPTASETLLDSFNRYHRIQVVHFTGASWVCGCVVSSAPE